MYEEYYGFTEKPFSLTPDPKYLFKSESHANAFELLQYAVRRREGFVVVTGDIGTGKTTLCRALLEEIDRNTFTALVLNPFLSEDDLLKLILQDFGVVSREDVKRGRLAKVSKQELIETIYDFLLGLLPLRASAVLIIDEAQNLPMGVLEQIRILSNLETDKDKLLQIVLVGQLNLQPLLKAPQMRQLDQRVSIRYQLRPLIRDEVAAYVSHRLNVAGGSASVTFHPKALDLVHRRSAGIPRLVNLICDRALLAAYSARTNWVSADVIEKAAESLELEESKPARLGWFGRRPAVAVTAAGAAISLAVAGGMVAPMLGTSAAPPVSKTARPELPSPQTPAADAAETGPQPIQQVVAAAEPTQRLVTVPQGATGYAILAASFPITEVSQRGSAADLRLNQVVGTLQEMGYGVRLMDVSLPAHGDWRRVLVGEYATLEDARNDARRLHQTPAFSDAQPIKY
jgi:general secretion pathway protein A